MHQPYYGVYMVGKCGGSGWRAGPSRASPALAARVGRVIEGSESNARCRASGVLGPELPLQARVWTPSAGVPDRHFQVCEENVLPPFWHWPRGCRRFQLESNLSHPTHFNSPEPQSHRFVLICRKKWYITWRVSQQVTTFLSAGLSFSDCSCWISRPGTKYQNSWTQTFDWYILYWVEKSSLCTMQLIDLGKVRIENLKVRTDNWDQVMDGWSST